MAYLFAAAANSRQIDWGDVPTWFAVLGAFAAALIALRQLRIQQADSERLTRQLERRQADEIDVEPDKTARKLPQWTAAQECWGVVIMNNSRRPIRNVTGRWQDSAGTAISLKPSKVAITAPDEPSISRTAR